MLIRRFSMRGGVHLTPARPDILSLPIKQLPVPSRLVVPLLQHSGVAARPVVWTNDKVKGGQLIAEPGGTVSAAVHSPISGSIVSVKAFPHPNGKTATAVEIENDGAGTLDDLHPLKTSWQDAAPGEILNTIAACGVVGTDPDPYPVHLSLSLPGDARIDALIVNGVEHDPCSAGAHRLLMERCEEVLTGVLILRKTAGAKKVWLAVADRELIAHLREKMSTDPFAEIGLARMPWTYPGGNCRVLSKAIAGVEIPSGEKQCSGRCLVVSASTAHAVWNAVCNGMPMVESVVTVAGPVVGEPANLLVRTGTPLRDVLDHCKTDLSALKKVVLGGSMRGRAQPCLDVPVTREITCIYATDELHPARQAHPCIRCGYCVQACPMGLVPSLLAELVRDDRFTDAARRDVLQCIECGACSWICPSKINLVHYIQLGKHHASKAGKANPA